MVSELLCSGCPGDATDEELSRPKVRDTSTICGCLADGIHPGHGSFGGRHGAASDSLFPGLAAIQLLSKKLP